MATAGLAHLSMGDFDDSRRAFEEAEKILLDSGAGERWDVDVCRNYRMSALWYLGRVREFTSSVTTLLREAVEVGDAFLARSLRAGRNNAAWLVLDDVDEARRQLKLAAIEPHGRSFHMPHFYRLFALCQIDLYEGNGEAAWTRFAASWRVMRRSMLMRRSESIRITAYHLRARCALAAAAGNAGDRRRYLRAAADSARQLEREQNHWNLPKAALLRGRIAAIEGDPAGARSYHRAAVRAFGELGMALHATASNYVLGQLVDGPDGASTTRDAEAWLRAEGVQNPARLVRLLVP
jgi:hypothetical protein